MTEFPGRGPAHRPITNVTVIGAGVVGLSTAWALQRHGVQVEVIDRAEPGAGASYGNAGYLLPTMTVPLPEPSLLRYGLRALLDRGSPVAVAPHLNAELVRFGSRVARNSTAKLWRAGMDAYRELNAGVFAAYDALEQGGVDTTARRADVVAVVGHAAAGGGLLAELLEIAARGQHVGVEVLTAQEARALAPNLSAAVGCAVLLKDARYIDPVAFVKSLAQQVRENGGVIAESVAVSDVERRHEQLVVHGSDGSRETDAVVMATGAWLPAIARSHGVTMPMYAGRGYSFSVPCRVPMHSPLYLPAARVAIRPHGDRARVAGVMEFQRPDAKLNPRHIRNVVRSASPLVDGLDWEDRSDEWVGSRPLTGDGLPLIGETRTEGVFVAGGHGMWGVTLGPVTGKLLAEQIVTGVRPRQLAPFAPCR